MKDECKCCRSGILAKMEGVSCEIASIAYQVNYELAAETLDRIKVARAIVAEDQQLKWELECTIDRKRETIISLLGIELWNKLACSKEQVELLAKYLLG